MFFSFVLDVFSRMIVGWQFAAHMRDTLVLDALEMAVGQRRPQTRGLLVHHSDQGSQYTIVYLYTPGELTVEIRDNGNSGAPATSDRAGHGLIGMRERVALYGGTLETGPRESGGFQIRARLPLA